MGIVARVLAGLKQCANCRGEFPEKFMWPTRTGRLICPECKNTTDHVDSLVQREQTET